MKEEMISRFCVDCTWLNQNQRTVYRTGIDYTYNAVSYSNYFSVKFFLIKGRILLAWWLFRAAMHFILFFLSLLLFVM